MSRRLINIDVSFALKGGNPAGGISSSSFRRWLRKVERRDAALRKEREKGGVGFYSLPYYENEANKIKRFARELRKRFEKMVVLGIGGSALGTRALLSALPERKGASDILVADNVDPEYFRSILESVDLGSTVFNVISKSGGTSETLAQFYVVKEALRKLVGPAWKEHIVITTDPDAGLLREMARDEEIISFSVPKNVGGRFSVFSPVGLFPVAFAGLDVSKLLAGARVVDAHYVSGTGEDNPVYLLSAVYAHFIEEKFKNVFVLFAYSQYLKVFGEWFCQLWGESLGKKKGKEPVSVGQTPVVVTGVTDQHSQLQLYSDGPDDKVFTFLKFAGRKRDVVIRGASEPSASFLNGKRLGDLFDAEWKGTMYSLVEAGRPVVSIQLDRRDEFSLGAAMYLFECVTALVGVSIGVNPFDQPGVEYGKKLTKAMMGDEASSKYLERISGLKVREGKKKVEVVTP